MIFDREKYIQESSPIEKELKVLFNANDALTIFEIGACEGEDRIRYARIFPNANIYTFEALPNNIAHIKRNINKYEIKNVSVHNVALSFEIGSADFYVSNGRPENAVESDWDYGNKSSSLLPPDKHTDLASFIKFNEKITVPTDTLQNFCKNNSIKSIDFIHMDVQGAELMVLQGAEDFIASVKAIWLEVSQIQAYKDQPLVDDINKFMNENNFVLAKNCLEGLQGDQLYISKYLYPDYEDLIKKINKKQSALEKVKQKLSRLLGGS
jgi:FkbM family methyltransferase